MRTSNDLMTVFVNLNDHELVTTSVEMWSEVFTAWAGRHGRTDEESAEQLGEYEEFLSASVWHLKQLRDASPGDSSGAPARRRAERILTGIFDRVAQSISFAERKIAGGKMPRAKESAVLGRDRLLQLLDDDKGLLDAAIKRHQAEP